MAFKAKCPYCGHVVQAPQESLGASGRCPKCGDFFTVAPIDEAPIPKHWRGNRSTVTTATSSSLATTSELRADETPQTTEVAELADAKSSFLQPAGVAALLLGGLGLLAASFPQWNWLTIPLGSLGALIGLGAVLWVYSQNGSTKVVPIAGAFVSISVLVVAFVFPSLLGPVYNAPRPIVVAPSAIEVIPLQLHLGPAPATDAQGYIDATLAGLQQGSIRVHVAGASIIPASKKHEAMFAIRLRVQLLEDAKELISKGLAFSGASGEPVRFVLKDASNKTYTQKETRTVIPDEKESRLTAFPTAVSDEVIYFTPVPAPGQDLRLDVPLAAWGGTATFRFLIPSSMVKGTTDERR